MHHINFKNCSNVLVAVFFVSCAFLFSGNQAIAIVHSCPDGTVTAFACPSRIQKAPNAVSGNSQGTSPVGGNSQIPVPVAGNSGCGADGFLTGNCRNGNTGTNGNTFNQSLQNPLKFASFAEFFTGLLHIIVIFAIPIIILMIIYAGFQYVMARGSEEQVTKATRSLTYAVLGGLIILGAELILRVIQGTVSQLTI